MLDAASAEPGIAAAAAAGAVLVPTLIARVARFGGYSGDVAPLEAADILQVQLRLSSTRVLDSILRIPIVVKIKSWNCAVCLSTWRIVRHVEDTV